MATGLRPYIENLLLIVLIAFCMITFIMSFVTNSNPDSDITDPKYGLNNSLSQLNSQIDQFNAKKDEISNKTADAKPSASTFLFLIFESAFYIPQALFGLVSGTIAVMSDILFGAFGSSGTAKLITTVILIITIGLIITGVLLVIKAIRTGESER